MRNLAELNITDYGDRAPPSPEVIAAFEREFDVSLPADYIAFLTYANGGCTEVNTILAMGSTDIDSWAVNAFCYLNEDKVGPESLWSDMKALRLIGELLQPEITLKHMPFARTGLGDYFVLDLATSPARVYGALADERYELVEIAASFGEFIDNLEIDRDPDLI